VRELQPGLWHWEAPHPWQGSERGDQVVASYAIDDSGRLLLFDPIAPPREIVELAAARETAIVLTCPWHERDARSLVERFSWPVFAPPPDSGADLMRKYGVSPEDAAGFVSPDLDWLLAGDTGEARLYAAGDRLPVGVEAFPGWERNDLVLWIESRRAIVVGDALVDFGAGLEIFPQGLPPRVTREQIAERLRPLLALPVEHVLATHGGPTDRAALERALTWRPSP
jgi:glyoxylase-like metal-dependent hydrolase (beta-lactamase superfamily II)